MMNSLFETFDPMMSWLFLNFSIIIFPLLIPTLKFFTMENRTFKIYEIAQNFMFEEMKASLSNKNYKTNIFMLTSVFFMILYLNLLGLLPFVYTLTSQMMFTLALAMPFWLSMILFSITKNTTHFLSHLVPLSTPLALSQFMTIIESISQIIRPITLSVRLCANMTAGHILMALASKPIFMFNMFSLILMLLIILELAVAFIQSYVFTMLLSMYLSETV